MSEMYSELDTNAEDPSGQHSELDTNADEPSGNYSELGKHVDDDGNAQAAYLITSDDGEVLCAL